MFFWCHTQLRCRLRRVCRLLCFRVKNLLCMSSTFLGIFRLLYSRDFNDNVHIFR